MPIVTMSQLGLEAFLVATNTARVRGREGLEGWRLKKLNDSFRRHLFVCTCTIYYLPIMSYGSVSKGLENGGNVGQESQCWAEHGAPSPAPETNGAQEHGESSSDTSNSVWQRTKAFYYDNIGLFFVVLAQILASVVCFLP